MSENGKRDNYKRAQMGQDVGFGKRPAILAIDLCTGMTDPKSPLGMQMDEAVEANARLFAVAREAGIPIIYTTVERSKAHSADPILRKIPTAALLEDGTPWAAIDRKVPPADDEPVIVKWFSSAFFGTPLLSYLIARSIDTLIVTGATTSGCVRATVNDAAQYGYRVIVPRECVADRAQAPHEANLFDISMKLGDVLSLERVLDHISAVKARS